MQSTRFDDASLTRIKRAAEHEGVSVSEFIRRAAVERAALAPGPTVLEQLGDAIGRFSCGTSAAAAGDDFGDALEERHARHSAETLERSRRHGAPHAG